MTVTTSYGTWNNYTGYNISVEADVADFINGGDAEWRTRVEETGAFENMANAYRDAVNNALPNGVTLAGEEFYGPYYAEDQDWDGDLDIADIIESIDLGDIVEAHDPDNTDESEAPAVTADHVRDLDNAHFSDMPVLVIDTDGQIEVFAAVTATERGARVIYDADRLDEYTGGELDNTLAEQLAAELNAELQQ